MRFKLFYSLFLSGCILGCFSGFSGFCQDQNSVPRSILIDTANIPINKKIVPVSSQVAVQKNRLWLVGGAHALVWTGAYIALNKAWYADYPKQNFHTFNDLKEWNQMDKAGHIWTAYQLARISGAAWKWTGLPEKSAVWLGGTSALAFQSIIEIQDGFSQEWGFSWWDMAANAIGSTAFIAQELGWKEQRIQVKMGYWPFQYPNEYLPRRNDLFGTGGLERILKDYNSQTYWLSANLHSFIPGSKIPRWLNLSIGYSSDLMLGGRENIWTDDQGNTVDRSNIPRTRRYYLSVDVDLTRIPTRSKFLRSVFSVCNAIKIPAPALEYNSGGKFRMHAIHQ